MNLWIWRERCRRARDAAYRFVADLIPARLVYFTLIRAGAWATTGEPRIENHVPDVKFMDVVKLWEQVKLDKKKIEFFDTTSEPTISFKDARRIMGDELDKDEGLRISYQSNIAMLIDDDLHVGHEKRNELADRLINLIFKS